MEHNNDATDSAFLDIAANLLAVIMIVTVFSLTAARHQTHSSTHPAARLEPVLRFIEPQRDLFPPFSSYFFVTAGRVAQWDQQAVLDALSHNARLLSGTTTQGRYEWLPEPLITRDIDTFQIKFFVDHTALQATEPIFTEAMALVADLINDYENTRTAPVFIVYPDGMETFVMLYARMQESRLRFRWFTRNADEPLFLGRHPGQFTDHAIYW